MSELTPRDRLVRDMRDRLLSEVDRRRRRSWRRKMIALGASGMVLSVAAVSAWAWILSPLFAQRGAHCFSSPDLKGAYVEMAFPDAARGAGLKIDDQVANATLLCESLWATGTFGAPNPSVDLFVCRDTDGALQVFPVQPGRNSCAAIGTTEPK